MFSVGVPAGCSRKPSFSLSLASAASARLFHFITSLFCDQKFMVKWRLSTSDRRIVCLVHFDFFFLNVILGRSCLNF